MIPSCAAVAADVRKRETAGSPRSLRRSKPGQVPRVFLNPRVEIPLAATVIILRATWLPVCLTRAAARAGCAVDVAIGTAWLDADRIGRLQGASCSRRSESSWGFWRLADAGRRADCLRRRPRQARRLNGPRLEAVDA